MQKVILKFNNPKDLWEFKMNTKANEVEINLKNFTLICDCNEADIELAIKKYKARVEEQMASPR